jgi:hypothetical protein
VSVSYLLPVWDEIIRLCEALIGVLWTLLERLISLGYNWV